MFTLPLTDPLWRKLDDAHRDRDIPALLRDLSETWDEGAAESLFWDCLCHQDTCYGATYASVPHLLEIAKNPPNQKAADDIAHFLGHVALVAFSESGSCGSDDASVPQGLPLDLGAWDRKLDVFRSLTKHKQRDLADPDYPQHVYSQPRAALQAQLDRYADILARPPVSDQDLAVIMQIRQGFFAALQPISEICAQAYIQSDSPDDRPYFLSGVAAAMGDRPLAQLFKFGDEGMFRCVKCEWDHDFARYDDRLAVYASDAAPGETSEGIVGENRSFLDYKDGKPNRADGFVKPCDALDLSNPAVARLHNLTSAQDDKESATKLSNFTGTYACQNCGTTTRLF